jgi:hypothetical protein
VATPTKVFHRVAPWNTEVKLGPSRFIVRCRVGRSTRRSADMVRMAAMSAPPTLTTGTEPRSARTRVSMMRAGKKIT